MMLSKNNRTIGLTIARILISLILVKDFLLYLIFADELIAGNAIMPLLSYAQILDGLNLEYMFLNFNNPIITYTFLAVGLLASISFLIGYRVKLTGIIIFFCLITIKLRALYTQDGGDNVVGTMIPLLLLASTYNLYNGKLNNNFKNEALQLIPILAGIGVIIEFCLVYFAAGLSKMLQPIWQNGEALYYILRIEDFRALNLNIELTKSAFFVKFSTWFTLFWELTFPLAIWFKKLRNIYLIAGIGLHIGIWMLMRIDNFSFVMLSIYPVFFLDAEYEKFYAKYLKKWFPGYSKMNYTTLKEL
ncbi:MAG: HTTM domain-containing protein [Bacteroidota bacterium]